LCHDTHESEIIPRRVAVTVTDNTNSIKRLFVSAVSTVTTRPQGVRGAFRGKDFMLDDQTFDADSDGH
jgi:hypothetical protein